MLKKVAIAATVTLGMGFAPIPSASQEREDNIYEQLDLLAYILGRIQRDYVDEVDSKEVIEAAIQGMLKSLDPHSTYLNPESFEAARVQMEGEYGGLGIEVEMKDGYVNVVSPIDDTPAARADIEGGDLITHIDGVGVLGKTLNEAVREMRGPVGAPITITIQRGTLDPFDVTLTRESIKVRSVSHRIEEDTIGYIRVATFNINSGLEVERAVNKIRKELGSSIEGIVIDLRNNPGGLLDEAIRISDAFLDRGKIVSTRGRHRRDDEHRFATRGDYAEGTPIVVLINAGSASASEIVAGALQDHHRAIVVGDKSFGKGTVQSEIRIGQNADHAIRLTTARYFTPSGRSIQERGIEPDIYHTFPRPKGARIRREADLTNVISNDQQSLDRAGEVPLESELEEFATIRYDADGKPIPLEDIQLKYAIRLLKGLRQVPKPQVALSAAADGKAQKNDAPSR